MKTNAKLYRVIFILLLMTTSFTFIAATSHLGCGNINDDTVTLRNLNWEKTLRASIDSVRTWAVGDSGKIIRKNGVEPGNWFIQQSSTATNLESVDFVTPYPGWVV